MEKTDIKIASVVLNFLFSNFLFATLFNEYILGDFSGPLSQDMLQGFPLRKSEKGKVIIPGLIHLFLVEQAQSGNTHSFICKASFLYESVGKNVLSLINHPSLNPHLANRPMVNHHLDNPPLVHIFPANHYLVNYYPSSIPLKKHFPTCGRIKHT
ncbi:hypothetical protein POVCU2_0023000 [Plasmodium ovale curtisi]|uniref:Uncharacterized protein n=1 Tax=Plasmodium ovale curtisi TaxID=864141 RepID=A0A1A8VWU4_PLAOA|nr:hypothetical protein POVCU2_0023000 [Plasmodium ovale curtisi]